MLCTSDTLHARRPLLALALLCLALTPLASGQPQICEPPVGPIVLEVESAAVTDSWVEETSIAGYTGSSYYRWNGSNHFNEPGNGILTYTVNVVTPGLYNMRIRNYHTNPDQTLENDCWTRFDGGTWNKSYSSIALAWNWATWFDPPSGSDYKSEYVLAAGTHTFEISARSKNFRIDRVHFYIEGTPGGTTETWPQTDCPSAWTDLGQGLAGTGGQVPALSGSGDLTPGSSNQIDLTNALASSSTNLVLGLSTLNVPFKGGVLVPTADFLYLGLPVSGSGGQSVPFTWPVGIPAGTPFFMQHWVSDPAAPANLSASNGLRGEGQ